MALSLSSPAIFILATLMEHGYDAYIVGGAVRDLLLNQDLDASELTTDYDITTNARPDEIQALFPESFYENSFGTVSVTYEDILTQMGMTHFSAINPANEVAQPPRIIDVSAATKVHASLKPATVVPEDPSITTSDQPHFQITTYRADESYDDFRRPTSMSWGDTLIQDLERRDFTINSMALDISLAMAKTKLSHTDLMSHTFTDNEYRIIDPHHGQSDLQYHMIKTVGNPEIRFKEDALRMLRAIRFAVQLNFQIEDETYEAIIQHAGLTQHISWERIRDEFIKMLKSEYPAEAIQLLDMTGLLTYIIPELEATKEVEQAGHHTTDVWTHSLDALRNCPSTDPVVRLATLLHDISKPETQAFQNQTITFYNHEVLGARVAKKIAERLRLSKHDCNRIFTLVRFHMFYYQPHNTDASIRRFMRKVGLENIDDILDLREGDRLGSGARKTSWRLEEMKARMIEQLHQPFSVTDLAINGHDLMVELKLSPGPILGKLLNELFETVIDKPELNSKDQLLDIARSLLPTLQTNPSPKPE